MGVNELVLFLERLAGGRYRLTSEAGKVVLEADSYRALRGRLDAFTMANAAWKIRVFIGRVARASDEFSARVSAKSAPRTIEAVESRFAAASPDVRSPPSRGPSRLPPTSLTRR